MEPNEMDLELPEAQAAVTREGVKTAEEIRVEVAKAEAQYARAVAAVGGGNA
jgi:hypothetical protein